MRLARGQTGLARFTIGDPRMIAVGLGGAVAIGLVAWAGAGAIGEAVLRAGWILPGLVAVHALQLALSGLAWQQASGGGGPGGWTWARIRWIREAVNSMLPVAQVGGLFVGVRLLGHRGVALATGSAGTSIDMVVEAVAQGLFTLIGLAALAAVTADGVWLRWLGGGALLMALCIGAMPLAGRAGGRDLVTRALFGLGGMMPRIPLADIRRMAVEVRRLRTHHRALSRAGALHLIAWLLGVGETWLALAAIGWPVDLPHALVIESLGTAARSAAFAIPGALGVQEGGLVLVCGLLGVPAETALALSVTKRARELLVGLPGLLAWQWTEGRRFARR
jgi:putative membrane protein